MAGIDRCLARELVSQAHLGLELFESASVAAIFIRTAGQRDTQIIVCAGDWIDRIGRDFRNAALFDVIAPGEVKVQCIGDVILDARKGCEALRIIPLRSEEHTSELQSLMRISYAVFCLKKK